MRLLRESLALAGLVFQIGAVWYFWSALPAQVPMHFAANGAPDSYGGKSTLILLPAIAFLIYGLLTVVSFFPQSFNYPVEVTNENRGRLQAIALALGGWLKAELTWIFAYIGWVTIRVSLGHSDGLGGAFLLLMLGGVGATVIVALVLTFRARKATCRPTGTGD